MAVVDDRWAGTASAEQPRQFDRQPPQDLAAEQSVLGGMLLSKDAIADVVEELSTVDFYKPAHATVYEVILNLYARGEPADVVTVAAELDKAGALARIGGAVYLHTLTSAVPTAANAAFYAQIVAEKAILRRLVEAGTRIVQLGYSGSEGQVGGGEVDEIVDRAQAEIYEVTERRTTEDYIVLEELLQPTMDEMDAIASRGGLSSGVPTGFADLDALTNGFHPGQMIIMAARPGVGKALALDTALPTPCGWTTMGAIEVGQQLLGADGRAVTVIATTGVLAARPCFEVEFSDGEIVVADAEHQWLVQVFPSQNSPQPDGTAQVFSTAQLAVGLAQPAGERVRFGVRVAAALDLPDADLPIAPYAYGVALAGRGCKDESVVDPEVAALLELDGVERDDVGGCVALGQSVEPNYLRASTSQRRQLLAGLLDVAGVIGADGEIELRLAAPLVAGVHELVVSLGYQCAPLVQGLRFGTADEVFRVPRKVLAHKRSAQTLAVAEQAVRVIVEVRAVPSVPVRCVQVDNDDHLYLAGRSMVPTHNSTLALDVARNASVKHRLTSVIFSLEMSKTEITMRLLSAEASIRLSQMRAGTMSEQDWQKIVRRMSEISDAPLFIDDSPNMTMMEIRAKARRLKQRNDLKLIVLDYLQLMSSGKKVESRQQEVSEFSRQMKLLAKELEVPVIAISQLNRGPEQRTDKRPMLSDLRESGSLEQDADMVILVHRPDAFEADDPRAGEADLIIAKHRNGPTATISVAHQLHYSRFTDLAPQ